MTSSDLAPDSGSLDGAETVSVVLQRPEGQTSVAIAGALRRAVSHDDRSFNGLRLNGIETVWHIPTASFGPDQGLQPGDTISAGSDVWSILMARREALGSRWRCICRKRP